MQNIIHYRNANYHNALSSNLRQAVKEVPMKQIENPKPCVLLIEDDPVSQRVAQLSLETKNYAVDLAGTGETALAMYQAKSYDLILMDMGLPDISGLEVTRRIRAIERLQAKHTPIIALTAHGECARQVCLAAGMDDFTTKPIELELLHRLLKSWV